MKRRHILGAAAALSAGWGPARLFAAPSGGTRFLFVFLRGGLDAASVLVPHASPFYYEARPNIAIPAPGSAAGAAVALDADWSLHPALGGPLAPLLARREIGFVPFAGTEDLSRSHFETQDTIELGQAASGRRDFRSGFMARLATQLAGSAPIAFTDQLPLCFQGPTPVPNVGLRAGGRPLDARQGSLVSSMYQGTPWAGQVDEGLAVRQDVQKAMADGMAGEMAASARGAVGTRGFEAQARRMAALMRERYTLGFVDVGGWDTHVGQGAATGYLAGRLEELGRGLAAFAEAMGPLWRDTTVVAMSEFGRTFRENGNRGTDHGHGGVLWVLGGASRPVVAGAQRALTRSTLNQDRDWPVLNDWRAVVAGLAGRQFALGPQALGQVFPGATALDLGLA